MSARKSGNFPVIFYEWIPANRAWLIKAALTVLRAYVVAGKPKQPIKNFARFEDWSGWVRSALVWLDEVDPLLGREQMEDDDPVRAKLRDLILAWFSAFRTAPATVKELISRACETDMDEARNEYSRHPALYEALMDHFKDQRSGEISSRYLGEFLKQYIRRVEQGARFEADGTSQNRKRWRIKIVDAAAFDMALQKFSGEGEPTHATHATHISRSDFYEFGESGESGESPDPRSNSDCKGVADSSELPNLTGDPAALWAVLKLYRGAERIDVLARKVGGWPQGRVIAAVHDLQQHGMAQQTGDLVMPKMREVR